MRYIAYMEQTPPLLVQNIHKIFKDKKVLNNVSLEVKPSEIFGLVGLNGVGKTTLIKIILHLLQQDEGSVQFFGVDNAQKTSRSKIAYLPEKFYPSTFLKGYEFLSLALDFYNKPYSADEAGQSAQKLGLDPQALTNKISKYSKGMGQKLGLLSVFLAGVPLLLLDEPMSGLDPSARIQLKTMLKDYKAQGNTIFFTSHILSDVEEMCDRIAVMHQGVLIFEGAPHDFLKQSNEQNLEKAFLKAIA